jgi:2-dehydro-3-deoxygluconokinase
VAYGLDIRPQGDLDFVALGALNHRLDPGVVPFRKAARCDIYASGAEFNVAANLADCFGLRAAIVSAMVDYPIGDLIAQGVRAKGVSAFYKRFEHNGSTATAGMAPGHRLCFTTGPTRPRQTSGQETSTGARS